MGSAAKSPAPQSPDILRRLPDQLKMLDLQLRSALEQQQMPKSLTKWEEFLLTFVEEGEANARKQSNGG